MATGLPMVAPLCRGLLTATSRLRWVRSCATALQMPVDSSSARLTCSANIKGV